MRKEERRKSLRDGEVLSLLGSDGKLLLVGGLAHVESMDVKGKGWGERKKKKKKRKKNTNHDLFCLRVGGGEQSSITVTLLCYLVFYKNRKALSGNKTLHSAVQQPCCRCQFDVTREMPGNKGFGLIDLTCQREEHF